MLRKAIANTRVQSQAIGSMPVCFRLCRRLSDLSSVGPRELILGPSSWAAWTEATSEIPCYGRVHLSRGKGGSATGSAGPGAPRAVRLRPGRCRRATDLFTSFALKEIRDAKRAGRPFYMQLDYDAPHDGRLDPGPTPPARLTRGPKTRSHMLASDRETALAGREPRRGTRCRPT